MRKVHVNNFLDLKRGDEKLTKSLAGMGRHIERDRGIHALGCVAPNERMRLSSPALVGSIAHDLRLVHGGSLAS